MRTRLKRIGIVTALTVTGFTGHARADGPATANMGPASSGQFDAGTSEKPAWLTDFSAGAKESYDSSVFLSSVAPKYYGGSSVTVPVGSVEARRDAGSWATTLSPKISLSFLPLLGGQTVLQALSLVYAPDFVFYHEQPSENYDAHRVSVGVKGQTDTILFALDDAFAFVDGSKFGPTYPGNYLTAWNVVPPRERREQIQDRTTASIQYDWNRWFIRPGASLLYYDLMTEQLDVPGYLNYVSRYDVNGGADCGYKINPDLAVTLGYRFGHQYQQPFTFPTHPTYDSSSDYQRVLPGLEGKPWKWLQIKIQGGPDFRNYGPDAPVNNPDMVTYYGEAGVTATITAKDALTFKYKQWQWVSSLGKAPYFDGSYDLNYHHQWTDQLGADLGGRLLTADYNSGDLASCKRDDWQYTLSAGLSYALNPHVNLTLAYTLNLGRNDQGGVADPETRDYDEQLVALGAQVRF